jgi:glycine cleavage system H protein
MKTPKELKYNKTDEWVKVNGNTAIIGISDYAQDQLSDIVYIEFNKEPGDSLIKGEVISTIESVKAAADVISPVGGKIVKVNESLAVNPEVLNSDPYVEGWLYEVELESTSDLDDLFEASDYDNFCESRH